MRSKLLPALLPALLLPLSTAATAWERHQSLMAWTLAGLSESARGALASHRFSPPCPAQAKSTYLRLAEELKLNPEAQLAWGDERTCASASVSALDYLAGAAVDEPDMGMDQNLPDSADPAGYRKWMGGSNGPDSQGFRHAYFGGWKIGHLVETFQIPLSPVGEAPERAELMARKARETFRAGDWAWGIRFLAWSIHYLQDLTQPFHAVQIPTWKMVPWYTLLAWPPSEAADDLVRESSRILSNYHSAYELYTEARLQEKDESPYKECLETPEHFGVAPALNALDPSPLDLARNAAKQSVQLAPQVGRTTLRFFGAQLKGRGYNLSSGKGSLDYAELKIRPDLAETRQELQRETCAALAHASLATRALIDWALQP